LPVRPCGRGRRHESFLVARGNRPDTDVYPLRYPRHGAAD
jgi:hypothetical protein